MWWRKRGQMRMDFLWKSLLGEGGASLLFPRIYSPLVLYFVLLLIIFSRERMEVIISIVGSLAAKAAEYAVDPLARQLSYLFKPRSKFLKLDNKVQELKGARERVQQSVNSATRKGDVISDDVQRWLTVVDKISEEAATQLQDDEGKATKRGMGTSRMLKLKVNKSIHSVDGIKHLLGETQSLHLDGMEDVGEMQMLYHPNVESFGQLRYMKVKNCNMMKNLFSFSIVKRLCQLEELEISDCENITNLIVEKEEVDENDILEFNKLRILKLNKLNRFSGSWCSAITFQSSTCLFDKKVNFPVLEKLEIRGMDNLERLWADQLVEHSFSKLTSISLWKCPKLLNVFPGNMLTRLQRLERLIIKRCKSVEEIIYEGGNSSSGGMPSLSPQIIQSDVEFPNLTSLTLRKLPNLKSIHHNKMHTINWPSLKQMEVKECHRVGIVFAKSGETSSEQPLFWVNQVSS
ncbi:hypothetical protein V6N13_103233 [Hibiscus sabdariffa]